jgi:hypothetical protein
MPYATLPGLDNPETSFPEKLSGDWTLVLLEKGTCCYRAGEIFAKNAFEDSLAIIEASSFEEAVKLAQAPKHILLLPHVHSITGKIEADLNWRSMGDYIFRLTNPPLYLVSGPTTRPPAISHCACIEPLKPLVGMEEDGIKAWANVETTQQAARLCADGEAEFCVTNEYGLKKYGLTSVRELKKMEICWHPYQYAG